MRFLRVFPLVALMMIAACSGNSVAPPPDRAEALTISFRTMVDDHAVGMPTPLVRQAVDSIPVEPMPVEGAINIVFSPGDAIATGSWDGRELHPHIGQISGDGAPLPAVAESGMLLIVAVSAGSREDSWLVTLEAEISEIRMMTRSKSTGISVVDVATDHWRKTVELKEGNLLEIPFLGNGGATSTIRLELARTNDRVTTALSPLLSIPGLLGIW